MIESLHLLELEWISWLHTFRTPFLDHLVKLLDFFDRREFFFILIPIIWFGNGWKAGFRLFSIVFVSHLLNHGLKEYFSYPRPFHLDPSLEIINVGGYGLPSGAAQVAILLGCLLITNWKSPWAWVTAVLYVGSVSFSRVYLGVHFPSDILAGWSIGLCLWLFFVYGLPRVEERLKALQPSTLFWLSQLVPCSLLFWPWQQSAPAVRSIAVAMGMGWGLFINHFYQLSLSLPLDRREYLLRAATVAVAIFLFHDLTLTISFDNALTTSFVRMFLSGLWVSLGCNLLCRSLFHRATPSPEIPLD